MNEIAKSYSNYITSLGWKPYEMGSPPILVDGIEMGFSFDNSSWFRMSVTSSLDTNADYFLSVNLNKEPLTISIYQKHYSCYPHPQVRNMYHLKEISDLRQLMMLKDIKDYKKLNK